MITLIDRQLIGNFFRAYGICLTSILALYIVVDLFTNLDDFTGKGRGIKQVIFDIGTFYSYRVLQIFDHLCEAILLLAAMFTVTWMQRCNEQVPLLAAGVSTGRIVAPVLFSSFALLSLSIINQEIFVPAVADKLVCQKDDPHGFGPMVVRGRYEPNGIHIEGEKASRTNHEVTTLRVTIPESLAGNLIHITARQAIFHPDAEGGQGGKWELMHTTPAEVEGFDRESKLLEPIDVGHYFLQVREVNFAALTQDPTWFTMESTMRIYQELHRNDATKMAGMAVLFHSRLTRPFLGMILVIMGLGVILGDQSRNMFISMGICLGLCGLFFISIQVFQMLGNANILTPALAAWLPILFFGPLSWVLFDAVQT